MPDDLRPYDPAAHVDEVVAIQVTGFALLALLGVGGLGAAFRTDGSDGGQGQAEFVSTEVDAADAGLGRGRHESTARKWGDRSPTWQWPGLVMFDRASRRWPERIAPGSPLLARVLQRRRLPEGDVRTGVDDAHRPGRRARRSRGARRGGEALPPAFGLAMALAVLGVFDAMAGIVAVTVFVGGVVMGGGLSSDDAVRTVLGLTTLWFEAPLIAGVARPLRRPPTMSFDEHFDRTADIVIASLVGAAAVRTILLGQPALSGLDLPIADRANEGALVVLAALVVRMLLETVAAHGYPRRLAQVQPVTLPEPTIGQRLGANLLIMAVFVFVAVSFLGSCWQLYVGAAMFLLPKLLALVEDRLPSFPRAASATPRGIVAVVLLLVIGATISTIVIGHHEEGRRLVRNSFVILALPGLVFAVMDLLGREGPPRQLHWYQQLWGIPVIVLGVILTLADG